MSLRVRLAAVVAATFAIVVVGCVFAAHVSASHELRAETDRFLEQRSHDARIQGGVNFEGGGPGPGQFPNRPGGGFAEPDALVQLIGTDGQVIDTALDGLPIDARDREIATHGGSQFRDATVNGTKYRVLTVGVPGGAAQIARSIEETEEVLSTLDIRLLLIALAGTVVAAILAWIIASRIVRPIEQLTAATEAVARTEDLTSTIDVDRRDELGRLASAFNTMLVALRTSREQQKRLVMDASHELRTPLTALRTNIDVLRRSKELDPAQTDELVGAVHVELSELTDLVAELVDLATDARSEEPLQSVDLGALAERVVARARRRTGREVTLEVQDAAALETRAGAVERALANLVDNACKFSASPAAVEVRVEGTTMRVLDRGPGIAEEDRAHVFDRFYRAPAARTMPGSGLGLAIVKQVIELQGGTVELTPRTGGGTEARISLLEQ